MYFAILFCYCPTQMNTEGAEKLVEVTGKWGEKTMDSRMSFNGKVIEAEFRLV